MVVACIQLPHFALRTLASRALREEGAVVLVDAHSAHPVILDASDAALAEGVEVGMPLSRAMGYCAALNVVEHDAVRVARLHERFMGTLEALGAQVEPGDEPGIAYFDAAPLVRLYGGELEDVVRAVAQRFTRIGDIRIGLGANRFVARVASSLAPRGAARLIQPGSERAALAVQPLSLLAMNARVAELFSALGLRTLGDLAALRRADLADRLGFEGARLHDLACGIDERPLATRTPEDPVEATMTFPDAVANLLVVEKAVESLAARAVRDPRCQLHAPRTFRLSATFEEGGTWEATGVLREAHVRPERIALAAKAKLSDLPGTPLATLQLQLTDFTPAGSSQPSLLADTTAKVRERLARRAKAVSHVQTAYGEDSLLQVVQIDPDARVPERRDVLSPHAGDDAIDAAI